MLGDECDTRKIVNVEMKVIKISVTVVILTVLIPALAHIPTDFPWFVAVSL